MFLEAYASRRRPNLNDLLQIENACIGETIMIQWNTLLQVFTKYIELSFKMIWLIHRCQEQPLWRYDQCQASICILGYAKEVAQLFISIFEAFDGKLSILKQVHCVFKRILVK